MESKNSKRVRITLSMSDVDAKKFKQLVQIGKMSHLGISEVKISDDPSPATSDVKWTERQAENYNDDRNNDTKNR